MYDCADSTLCHWSFQIPYSSANRSTAFSHSNNVLSRGCGNKETKEAGAALGIKRALQLCSLPETAVEPHLQHERNGCMQICARTPWHVHV